MFHLAALIGIPYSYRAARSYVKTNVGGTLNVLQAVRAHGVRRMVHVSTSEVYGTAQLSCPSTRRTPSGPNPLTRLARSGPTRWWSRSSTRSARPRGHDPSVQHLWATAVDEGRGSTIIAQCLAGGPIRLGSLAPTRDLNFVTNTVDAFVRAGLAANVEGATINVGSGQEISIGELAARVAALAGRDAVVEEDPARVRPAGSEVKRLLADNSLARDLLGWTPRLDLFGAVRRTLEWMCMASGRLSRRRIRYLTAV